MVVVYVTIEWQCGWLRATAGRVGLLRVLPGSVAFRLGCVRLPRPTGDQRFNRREDAMPFNRFEERGTMSISVMYLLWAIPILVAVSLVMAGTRHERFDWILQQAWRNAVWTVSFLGTVAALIAVAIWWIGS